MCPHEAEAGLVQVEPDGNATFVVTNTANANSLKISIIVAVSLLVAM